MANVWGSTGTTGSSPGAGFGGRSVPDFFDAFGPGGAAAFGPGGAAAFGPGGAAAFGPGGAFAALGADGGAFAFPVWLGGSAFGFSFFGLRSLNGRKNGGACFTRGLAFVALFARLV